MDFKKHLILQSNGYTDIMKSYSVCSLAAKALAARKNKINEKELFSHSDFIYSPFDLVQMDRAVERINDALENGEKIIVYGDYDTDGVTATVILYSYLEAMGADVDYYIPDRESEGYGLNIDAIKSLVDDGAQLIVTVDNGIAAVDEIEYAKSLGVDVVVTDHHKPQAVLPSCIVVDPHREDCSSKFKDICGAFVAFKLVAALDGGEYDGAFEQYAELVALATVADIVPLVSENRTIVRLGLERMRETDNIGLLALIEASLSPDSDINSTAVTYSIVPRINAAGRMSSAKKAAELLLCDDEDRAQQLCNEICSQNNKRKDIETEILEEIDLIYNKNPEIFSQRVIVVSGDNWHHGVLGIVASKLVERYLKPAIVLSNDGKQLSGSGRSVEGFSLFDAVSYCKDALTKFGGHSLAVGVSLDTQNLEHFSKMINSYAAEKFVYMPINSLVADALISPQEITLNAVKELSILEPFGKDNPSPAFAICDVTVTKIASIGNGKHTRFSLSDSNTQFSALCFGSPAEEFRLYEGKKVDIIVRLKTNVYAGEESVTVQIASIRPSGIDDDLFFKEKQLFDSLTRREKLSPSQAKHLMPSYEEAGALFRVLRGCAGLSLGDDEIWYLAGGKINRAKISVIMNAFKECELILRKDKIITLTKEKEKKDLFGCDTLKFISEYLKP